MNNFKKTSVVASVIALFVLILGLLWLKHRHAPSSSASTSNSNHYADRSTDSNVTTAKTLSPSIDKYMASDTTTSAEPQWVIDMLAVSESNQLSRIAKITLLSKMLELNQNDPVKSEAILTTLMPLQPIEISEQIIAFLSSNNAKVQLAALSALSNASVPTDEELNQPPNALFIKKRSLIAHAFNQVFLNKNTPEDIKNSIISLYSTSNSNPVDTAAMTDYILAKTSQLSSHELHYIGEVLTRSNSDAIILLDKLAKSNQPPTPEIVKTITLNLNANPDAAKMYTPATKERLLKYMLTAPPLTTQLVEDSADLDAYKQAVHNLRSIP